ncbi:lysine transporter LysE [Thermogymnomonas acidicola]|uniref:Lysine transporter LysE n=1 Tax=Thermogymnomonas acidicola TaxID=399579 RepID=A0AA37F9W2_9ARCH|nr:lysine transporter LysE [Thermogymnomonas acidicola]
MITPYLVLFGVVLGVSLAAPPGPINAMIISEARRSVLRAVLIGFGAMTADLIFLIIVFLFGSALDLSRYDPYIYTIGGSAFIVLAYLTLRSGETESGVRGIGYLKGLGVGIGNPAQIGWWLSAGLSTLERFGIFPFYFLFVGTTVWVVSLSYLIRLGELRYGSRMQIAVKVFSTAVFAIFGAVFLYLGVSLLLSGMR